MNDWRAQGCCVNSEVDFHDTAQEAQALVLCGSCPVQPICLQEALDSEEEWGVWGGTTPGQRRRLVTGRWSRQPRPCIVCGTPFLRSHQAERMCSQACVRQRNREHTAASRRRMSVA